MHQLQNMKDRDDLYWDWLRILKRLEMTVSWNICVRSRKSSETSRFRKSYKCTWR